MRNFYLVLVLLFAVSSRLVIAQIDLNGSELLKPTRFSQQSIQSFIDISQKIAKLNHQYPEIAKLSANMTIENQAEIIQLIEKSSAYPTIKTILAPSPFNHLTSLFDFSERMLAMSYWRRINNAEGADPFQTVQILEVTLMNLKANNSSEALIQQAEKTLEQQKAQAKVVRAVLDKLSDDDKVFISDNKQWLDKRFPQ